MSENKPQPRKPRESNPGCVSKKTLSRIKKCFRITKTFHLKYNQKKARVWEREKKGSQIKQKELPDQAKTFRFTCRLAAKGWEGSKEARREGGKEERNEERKYGGKEERKKGRKGGSKEGRKEGTKERRKEGTREQKRKWNMRSKL